MNRLSHLRFLVAIAALMVLLGSQAGYAAKKRGDAIPKTPATAEAAPAAVLEPVTVDPAARPRPPDLNFTAAKDVQKYLSGLPEKAMKRENSRIRMMTELRGEWMKSKIAYDGDKKGIKLKNGSTVRGTPMVNDNEIMVMRRGGGKTRLKPADIATAQHLLFMEDYVQQKISRSGSGLDKASAAAVNRAMGGGTAATDIRQLVSNDCFRLAILLDWYEKPEQAKKYAADAIRFNAEIAPAVHAYFPAAGK